MSKFFIILYAYFLLPAHSLKGYAQVIETYAGDGLLGNNGDGGLATSASIASPNGLVFDKNGNCYFADASSCTIRMVAPSGVIYTIAGGGSGLGDGGPATNAILSDPLGVSIDTNQNLYIADNFNRRVRKIDLRTGIIKTIAGNGINSFSGDGGPASNATFRSVENICIDGHGNLYILDYTDSRVRKIDPSGVIVTFAGNGVAGESGDNGLATNANIENMVGICVDALSNVYIAESGSKIRKIDVSSGIITTFAGVDSEGAVAFGDGGPATNASIDPWGILFDFWGNMYVSGYLYNDVRKIDREGKIHTIAGTGFAGYNGDGLLAVNSELNSPTGITLDSCGNLYISEIRNHRIRKVLINPECWPETVETVSTNLKVKIYPNPLNEELHIDNVQGNATYTVRNIVGAAILRGVLHAGNNIISMVALPPGLYLLVIEDEENNKSVHKFIRQ
jgi:Secretion system C-terminal sorting domain